MDPLQKPHALTIAPDPLTPNTPITNNNFRRIGAGACGSVWAVPGLSVPSKAIKREDCNPARSVYKDYVMHRQVRRCLSDIPHRVHVPRCHEIIGVGNYTFWDEQIGRFPEEVETLACNALGE